jgi:hypothetical protein
MTAAGLIVLSVACLIAAVAGAILVTYLDIRAERKWRHWDSMPGATSSALYETCPQCGYVLPIHHPLCGPGIPEEAALAGRARHGRQGDPGCAGAKSSPESRPETPARPASAKPGGDLLTLATKWARDDWEDEGIDVIETEPLFGRKTR